jgi:pSer/pThr/pTyr-binding forkhead associated (FHA) protein
LGAILTRSPRDDAVEAEQRQLHAADQHGVPYLVLRDDLGNQLIFLLGQERITVGRGEEADLTIAWDRAISRRHAILEWTPKGWSVLDDGQSLNGTLVNGDRIRGRRALVDCDLIQVGETAIAFCEPD